MMDCPEDSSLAMVLRWMTCLVPVVSRISTEVAVSASSRPERLSPSFWVTVHSL